MAKEQNTQVNRTNFPQRPKPVGTAINKWMIQVHDTLKAITPVGSTIPRDSHKYVAWRGTYDEQSAYAFGDMVKVTTPKSYLSGSTAYNSYPGIYMCVQNIPANITEGNYDAVTLAAISPYRRSENSMVHPVYPEAENQYWQLIAFLPTLVTICEDNEAKEYYVNAQETTGSV